ncbi:MAG: bifunctional diguanylate cyclase/phosphodiesterase [Bacillota bacterium]
MSLGNGKDLSVSIQLFEIISNFKKANNINIETIGGLLKNLCDLFDMDRVVAGRRVDVVQKAILPVLEYEKNGDIVYFNVDFNFDPFANENQEVDINEKRYAKMVQARTLYDAKAVEDIQDVLTGINYKPQKEGKKLSEMIAYGIALEELFAYTIFERYEGNDKFSDDEMFLLKTVCEVITFKIKEIISEHNEFNEKTIKDAIIQNEKMPICMVEQKGGTVIYFNELFKKVSPTIEFGASSYEVFGATAAEDLTPTEAIRLQTHLDTNDKYWIKKTVPITFSDGREILMIYVKDASDYIKQLEGIDLLTSAFSMKGFVEYYNSAIKKGDTPYMIFTIDIDKFKYINGKFGFDIGNDILKNVADVLNHFIERPEAYCRITEDKFAILLRCDTKEEATAKIEDLFARLDAMQSEHFEEIKITFICGAARVNRSYPMDVLIDNANQARKIVKGSHKNSIGFFDVKKEEKLKEEAMLEQRIPYAVDHDEFVPFLQPKFDLNSQKICGAEALVRWVTAEGMIFPDQFIPLFERDGFINTLDFIVYEKIMIHIRECLDKGLHVYPISLNVSRSHIQNEDFVNQVMDLIERYDIPVNLIELELTENIFVEDRETLKFFIDTIKRPKIKVSIDDFGSAYSSLQVLKDIDVDILKIDKGFLNNIDFSLKHAFTKDEVVLKNIINMAKDLNCKVICEGIETEEQVGLLKGIGCQYGQGYIFARPMPIEEYVSKFLEPASKE